MCVNIYVNVIICKSIYIYVCVNMYVNICVCVCTLSDAEVEDLIFSLDPYNDGRIIYEVETQ